MSASAGKGDTGVAFRPRARILRLLGDELIGSSRLAVFELVKNAYDADARRVKVCLDLRDDREPMIVITDDGEGMTRNTLESIWFELGHDHRKKQRQARERTPRFHRLPLGEKGLGRFAMHKLGDHIKLVTRSANSEELVLNINWDDLVEQEYLDKAFVKIEARKPENFPNKKTGTKITIRRLKDEWKRGAVRRLHNQIVSICSPFGGPEEFSATLEVLGKKEWIENLLDIHNILDQAIWKFKFYINGGKYDWRYEFREIHGLNLQGRTVRGSGDKLVLPPSRFGKGPGNIVADKHTCAGIGKVSGEFYVYDRAKEITSRLQYSQMLTKYLNEGGGVRVYRDGVRVYDYGEPENDWLGLDLRRVNAPTRGISRNIILGAIHLSLEQSSGLVEKTNREGFIENEACHELRRLVIGALSTLEKERKIDKERIRKLTGSPDNPMMGKIEEPMRQLRAALQKQGIEEQFEHYLKSIEGNYKSMQEIYLSAGLSGLNLALVFHEVERGVRTLSTVISERQDLDEALERVQSLVHMLDGFSVLLRRDSRKRHSIKKLVEVAHEFSALRFKYHNVDVSSSIFETGYTGVESNFAFNLVLGALNNLIDNALYWLRVRWTNNEGLSQRKIRIACLEHLTSGPAILVSDNGTGFQKDDPEHLLQPFFTRKPDGMGLGLYYAQVAMELNGGQIAFPDPEQVDVPSEYDGATVALIFPGGK